jgi:DNA-binding SARP family transcriptional activator
MRELSLRLSTGYYLERGPDVLVLRRLDGAMVGAFSARGAAPEALRRAIEEFVGEEEPAAGNGARSALRARFFGHFELLCDGEPVHLGRNGKAIAILKYLIANRRRLISQDHLMGWLWPESNLKKARWSLNSAVHCLRKILWSCPSSEGVSYVVLEEGHYRLGPGVRVATDVDEFDERHEEGRRLESEGRHEEAVACYERAVGLYRGDYLIEDLYEDWTMIERERLANAYMDALGRLAARYMEAGRLGESIETCFRALEKDRCHEDSHRLLMRCYARLGQRGRTLRQYKLCERVLAQEYGTAPSPETRVLYGDLLADEAG